VTPPLPKVIVLALNWNRKDLVLSCLASLREQSYENFEVAVVDNGSTDGSENEIRQRHPWAEFIQNGDNLGYAGGNNQGIRAAIARGADYVFLVNNDTKFDRQCIAELVKAAEKNRDYGILGPVAFSYDGGNGALNSGFQLDWTLDRFFPFHRIEGNVVLNQSEEVCPVDAVQGDAFFVRREVFERIGLFDERFFLLVEECDFCLRAKEAGFMTGVAKGARFYRMISPSVGTSTPLRSYYATRNILLLISKHAKSGQKGRIQRHFLKKIGWDLKGYYLPERHLKNAMAHLHGCFDYFLNRFGRCRLYS